VLRSLEVPATGAVEVDADDLVVTEAGLELRAFKPAKPPGLPFEDEGADSTSAEPTREIMWLPPLRAPVIPRRYHP
jgi:hypothetical protein